MKYRKFALMFLALTFVAGICDKQPPEKQWERGDFEPIGGKTFNLAQGLDERSLVGYEDEIPASFLPLKFVVSNTTDGYVTDKMPEGLVFHPRNREYQFMILVQEFEFGVPPNQDTTIYLPTYCCNEDLDEPDEDANYDIDIQVWELELCDFFDLLRGKRLEGDDVVDLVQEALFEITDYDGLTDSTAAKLRDLP